MEEVIVTSEEFQKLNLKPNGAILAQLEKKYPEEFNETLEYLKEFVEITLGRKYNLLEVMDVSSIIDEVEERIPDDILINYYVKQSVGTDTSYSIMENGYAFKEEAN